MGDFVKGSQFYNYPESVRAGILLHRAIDHFTDNHSIFLKTKLSLQPRYRHYAAVIVDIYYDHYLADNWNDYAREPLKVFTGYAYRILSQYQELFPKRVQQMLYFMTVDNWLLNYASLSGIERAFHGLSRRTKFDSGMENAVEDLQDNYEQFKSDFQLFFPDLQQFVDKWKLESPYKY